MLIYEGYDRDFGLFNKLPGVRVMISIGAGDNLDVLTRFPNVRMTSISVGII